MHCSSCHEVHSARPRIRDLQLKQDVCVNCHRAYRGPFVFAHQASRQDGCIVCHTPHGTSNRRLMLQTNSQQNCIACHGDFPSFHDQTQGSVFTNCMNCHTEVHGSNHSRFFFR
jgi:predicted CXXCH cytochrome family protein